MKRCTRCVLPETFPGIQFDEHGVCQYCRRLPAAERRAAQKAHLRARFEDLAREVRARPGYHCLMSWSGGKDSSYTLWLLRQEYGLRVLAFTFDNGFVSPAAMDNMRLVGENLGVDHVIVKPDMGLLRRVFVASMAPGTYPPKALERASGICNACMGLAKGIGLRMALEKEIPLLAYGWSPGQIPVASALWQGNREMLRAMVEAARQPLQAASGGAAAVYFPTAAQIDAVETVPFNVSPLVFIDYDEERAVEVLAPYGWTRPLDTDPNSTNCLLNSYANQAHLEQMGYHPYAMELAGLVREGYMSRQEALDRLEVASAPEIVAMVEHRLGLPDEGTARGGMDA